MNAAQTIWDRMRITPPAARPKPCLALVRYDAGFAAWQLEHEDWANSLRSWRQTLVAKNPKLKLSRVTQAELPI